VSQSNDIATGESPDMVWGVAEIAKVIGKNERQTFYLVSKGLLPVQKTGRRYSGSRRRLLRAVTGEAS